MINPQRLLVTVDLLDAKLSAEAPSRGAVRLHHLRGPGPRIVNAEMAVLSGGVTILKHDDVMMMLRIVAVVY